MKNFFLVLKFELMGFIKSKGFIISTLIICLLLAIGLSIPTIKDLFFPGDSSEELSIEEDLVEEGTMDWDEKFAFLDETGGEISPETIEESFFGGKLVQLDDLKDLEDQVMAGEFEAGFVLKSPTEYEYVVVNNELMNFNDSLFQEALARAYKVREFAKIDIEYEAVEGIANPHIESETRALGKDSAKNYMYTYALVFGLYFIIVMYGQLIATSVASEKSNRAMEVLVTSTSTKNLIFGKVIGGALAGIIQFGLVIMTAGLAYKLNSKAWDGALDFIFSIPANILLTFSVFGILGYLFFAFIYGALGALVSRTEDISASATPITIIFVVVFMVAMFGMQNTEGIILKIASFIPFSSFMAMFVRVSMGSVTSLEVVISLSLLALSTGLIGILAAKIYRMGTLMYGNRVKLGDAIRLLRSK